MKQPQDHKKPAGTPVEDVQVEYGGNTYTLPGSMDDLPGDVLEAIDDQKLSYVVREMLGAKQWKAFKATKPRVRDYSALFDAWAQAVGLESQGE